MSAQLALALEPVSIVANGDAAWRTVADAPRDRAIQIGYWIAEVGRWSWLFHTAWNEQRGGFYCDGEELAPSHWRDIGTPPLTSPVDGAAS